MSLIADEIFPLPDMLPYTSVVAVCSGALLRVCIGTTARSNFHQRNSRFLVAAPLLVAGINYAHIGVVSRVGGYRLDVVHWS